MIPLADYQSCTVTRGDIATKKMVCSRSKTKKKTTQGGPRSDVKLMFLLVTHSSLRSVYVNHTPFTQFDHCT